MSRSTVVGFRASNKPRRLVAGAGCLTAMLAPVAAEAADLDKRRASDAMPAFVDWSGGYLGAQASAGASYGEFDFGGTTIGNRAVPAFRTGDATGSRDRGQNASTALGGLFGGWTWQTGPWAYGIEADISAANLKRPLSLNTPGFGFEGLDTDASLIRAKTDLYGSLRARLGYSFERYLVYASFGLAGANSRFLATYPDAAGGVSAERAEQGYLGFTLGAGVQFAFHPNFALGIDYRYVDLGQSRRFDLGALPGPNGGPVSTRVSATGNQMFARLMWFPEGLRLPSEPDEIAPHDPDNGDTGRFSLHGQTTLIAQGVPGFRSPYLGPQSLVPAQTQQTTTATLFLGFKLLEGTELYYNPEFSQGFGLSGTTGVAGFVNGEAQKAGAAFPRLRSNRYFVRQTFGLGGETEDVPDGPNQVATRRDVERITLVAGKFALGDFFDGNRYAHDPRVDFLNWSLWSSSAWDFPANLPGFTQGVVAEYNRKEFAIRAAYTQVPKQPSSDVLDPRVFERAGFNVEFEGRFRMPELDRPGVLRLGFFTNVGNAADFREVAALTQAGVFADAVTATALTRRPRRKTGFYANLEQELTDDLGLFARASFNDGRNESLSFTDVDQSFSGGFSLKGAFWGRPNDTVGIGATVNGISQAHRSFFAAGGLGLLIGDGRLARYAPESAFEAYYAVSLTKAMTVTFDYQHVENPAYNLERGPADFFAARLHVDF